MDPQLPKLFETLPKADYEVRAVEPFREKSAAGGSYQAASEDGSRPGIFYANAYDLKARPKWAMEALSLHDGWVKATEDVAAQMAQQTASTSRSVRTPPSSARTCRTSRTRARSRSASDRGSSRSLDWRKGHPLVRVALFHIRDRVCVNSRFATPSS